jgi:hypothetical protein
MRKLFIIAGVVSFVLGANFSSNKGVCGIFPSVLSTFNTLNVNSVNSKVCGTSGVSAFVYNDSNHNLKCSLDLQCGNLSNCVKFSIPKNRYNPVLLDSKELVNIPYGKKDYELDKSDYKSHNFNGYGITIHFTPKQVYEDNQNVKYMTLGGYTFNGKVTLSFEPGDYYFDTLVFNGNDINIELPNGGPVRIFVKNDLNFNGSDIYINKNGDSKNLFIYVGGNFQFQRGGIIKAYMYVKGDANLNNNINDFEFHGGLTAEGNINIGGNRANYYYDGTPSNLGYGKCNITLYHKGYVDFKPIHQENIFGNIISVGNTNECVTSKKAVNNLNDLQKAKCEDDIKKYYNNYYMTKFINIMDSNSSIFNSSSATIKFPKTYKKIKFAAIFWQGHVNNYSYKFSNTSSRKKSYDKYYYDREKSGKYKNKIFYKWISKNGKYYYYLSNDLPQNNVDNIKNTTANEIVAFFNGKPVKVVAKELDYASDSRKFKDDMNNKFVTKYGVKYSAYAEIDPKLLNSLVKNNELNVTVANIYSTYGLDFRLGDYSGWSLVVIYEEDSKNPDSKLRSNSVYYGFQNLSSKKRDLNIKIEKLLLPRYGSVDAKLTLFTAEGEYKNHGDENHHESVKVNSTLLSNYYKEVKTKDGKVILKNYDNRNNVMDSLLSDFDRKPFLVDNNGIDIDNFDATDAMTIYRDMHPSKNGIYDVNIHLSTYKDGYFVSEISFSNELYQPRICYYIDKIVDLNGNVVYENGKFVSKVNSAKDYNISFWIANMKQNVNDTRIDVARNVKVEVKYNNFKYMSHSTYVKNIGSIRFRHISDTVNDDIGEFISDKNQTVLRIGRGADFMKGGIIPPSFSFNDNSKKVFVNVAGKFLSKGNKEIDLDDYLEYFASYKTPYVTISEPVNIPKCKKFNTVGEIYRPSLGTFNVVNDKFSGNVDPIDSNHPLNALYTQVVNKPFNVKILHLGDDKQTLQRIPFAIVMLEVVDANDINSTALSCKNAKLLYRKPIIYFLFNKAEQTVNLKIPVASKNATFRVKYIDWMDLFAEKGINCFNNMKDMMNGDMMIGGVPACLVKNVDYFYKAFPGNLCMNEEATGAPCLPSHHGRGKGIYDNPFGCAMCLMDFNSTNVCARDNFAIRPDKFEITSIPENVKAGEEFNITLKAVDVNGNPVKDYNESVGDNYYDSLELIPKILKSNCNNGKLEIISGNIFKDGIAKVTLTYNEIGDINLTLREKPSKEYAAVDEDDTDENQRFIKEGVGQVYNIVPDYFKVTGTLDNYKDGFTYISSDLNMSAILNLTISAMDKNGKVVKNYNNQCYAKNIEINVSKTLNPIPKTLNKMVFAYKDINGNISSTREDDAIGFSYSKDNFVAGDNNGSTTLTLYINFDKNYSTPDGPFVMQIDKVNVKNEDINASISNITGEADYRYGRIFAREVTGYGNEVNTTFKYQYWNSGEWVDNSAHTIDFGDVDFDKSYINTTLLKDSKVEVNSSGITSGKEPVIFKTTHLLPYGVKIHLAIPSWLWYNPLTKEYKAPSKDNLNCLTHPCIKVNFLTNSTGWGGIESDSQAIKKDFNASKRTVNVESSSKSNVSKKEVRKLNW